MEGCPELIVAPCRDCDAHVMSYLNRADEGRSVIKCGRCGGVLFDRPVGEETERFIRNQMSYYALAAEVMPEFAKLFVPGDSVPIEHPEGEQAGAGLDA